MAFEITTHSKKISPSITFDTAAYASGDNMGGKITLTGAVRKGGGSAVLSDITVLNNDGTKPTFNIIIFSQDPTAATITDNAAFVISTDIQYVQAIIPVYTVDYIGSNTPKYASIQTGNIILQETSGSSTSLYAAIVATAANDLTAATDLRLKFGFIQD